jgi:hypothetical protein
MKKALAIGLTLLGLTGIVSAQSYDISLTWTANPPTEMVSKYVVFQAIGTNGSFVPVVTANGTNFSKVRVIGPGLYKFKVQAVNGVTNSALSEYVQVPNVGPATPPAPQVIAVEVK